MSHKEEKESNENGIPKGSGKKLPKGKGKSEGRHSSRGGKK